MASSSTSTAPKPLSALLSTNAPILDHEEILRACNTSSSTSRHKPGAQKPLAIQPEQQHIRFIALLKLDRYDDALRVLDEDASTAAAPAAKSSSAGLKDKVKLERAYALYKVGEFEEAKRVAREVKVEVEAEGEGKGKEGEEGERERGARHVEAQASYRSEDFANAAAIYGQLQRSGEAASLRGEESDLRVNSGATDAQLQWKGQGALVQRKTHTREDLEAFETAYNAACGSIARGELGKGEFLLNTAKGLCASLDELSDAEKSAEILPIQVQQLYVFGRLGKAAEAEKLASEISIQEISDAATRQIAQNNLLASTSTGTNPYLSHRLIHDSPTLSKTDTLFTHQAALIEHNTLASDLLASKSSAVIKSTARSLSANPSPTIDAHVNDLSVLNAAAHAQSQLAKLGLKSILPLLSKRPTDIGLAMTVVQLYMLTSNPGAASTVLESLLRNISTCGDSSREDILYAPGLVALQVSLYSLQNRRSTMKTLLAKAASYWRHRSKATEGNHHEQQQQQQQQQAANLLRAAGLELLSSSNPDQQTEAREIFTALHAANSEDKFATAGFIAAHALPSCNDPSDSTIHASLVKQADAALPSIARLTQGLDISTLEAAGMPALPSTLPQATSDKKAKKRKGEAAEKPKKKRLRLSKRPKDYVEGKKMDDERWLPLRERSSYRPKGKKGKKRQAEQTQGGPVERTAADGKKAEANTAGGLVMPPSAGGGGAAKGKGKKKGKK